VLSFGAYSVYVHAEGSDRHHLPHCHVRWKAGGSVPVSLATLMPLEGTLTRTVRDLLREHRSEIIEEWNRLNPYRPVEGNE
jgi:hypothetical protein